MIQRRREGMEREEKRARVYERDGGRCRYCNRGLKKHNMTLDHIRPLHKGGTHADENLALACLRCNIKKANNMTLLPMGMRQKDLMPSRKDPFDFREPKEPKS